MTPLTRLGSVVLAACLLAGCDAGSDEAPEAAPTSPTASATAGVGLPHFKGSRAVTLHTGRIYYSDQECTEDPTDDRVCEPDSSRQYAVFGATVPARLVEARMDLGDGGTAWTARLVFTRGSKDRLVAQREEARSSGAVVLVLDDAQDVLVAAPVDRIEGHAITFPELAKSEAWDLVERFTGG